LANAHRAQTPAQRAAEIAPVIETAVCGLDSLLQLVDGAEARAATRPPADR
jgi:hypothetical protein